MTYADVRETSLREESDRTLLEYAAKAAGYEGEFGDDGYFYYVIKTGNNTWEEGIFNPLQDDGDALRLAVKLKIDVCYDNNDEEQHVNAWPNRGLLGCSEFYGEDPCAATRKAIVRAAAEIGKAMESKE